MSWRRSSKSGSAATARRLSLVPGGKWSTHSTSAPSATRRSQRCEPRKPAPPVTSTRLRCESFISFSGDFGEGGVPAGDEARDVEALERRAARLLAQCLCQLSVMQQGAHPAHEPCRLRIDEAIHAI